MTQIFEYFGITRDSILFLWTKIASLALLVATGALDPATLGLTDRQKHALMLTCGLIAYLSGQYSTSSLSAKADANKSNTSTITKVGVLLFVLVPASSSGCIHPAPPTKVAAVADVGSRIEASAGALLSQAQTAQSTINPATGKTWISRGQLDVVALAVDKAGRLGEQLKQTLDDYNALKAAGKDVTAQIAAVQGLIADLTSALQDIGKSIPSGTVQSIDQAVTNIFAIVAEVKAGVGLS